MTHDNLNDAYKEMDDKININHISANKFLYNDYETNEQVQLPLNKCLASCDEFMFSVAFITLGGLQKIKLALKNRKKGCKGRIITTNYDTFTDPKALRDLLRMPDIEVRMYYINPNDVEGFHTKGYIFREGDEYSLIIGSSNLTANALTINKEWNSLITGKREARFISNTLDEFEKHRNKSRPLSEVIDAYEQEYKEKTNKLQKIVEDEITTYKMVKPNAMQQMFIDNLNKSIEKGEKRGLLISATGTGKTFASAFGLKCITKFPVKKVLFICHREKILKQSIESYKAVFGQDLKTALYTGNSKDIQGADFIFASFALIQKDKYLNKFHPEQFDVVVIDEVHRVGKNNYLKIINHFNPKFLLGMSATPDRTDAFDIYEIFDYNILYEIRLMGALESNMVVPFNYFGVKDISVNGQIIDDNSDFNLLTADERVDNILENLDYYGYDGVRAKGLIFVSSLESGKELSKKFNERGLRTVFLDGSSREDYRDSCIERLETDDVNDENRLDYIFVYDIFNEGIDIPSINQVVMLRPTESSIIFLQQLGRGLRKYRNKEFLVVLDFIGNYANNYKIIEAITKRVINGHSLIRNVDAVLPGSSTMQFEPILKEYIFKSIEKASINDRRDITLNYIKVRNRLGRVPTIVEFEENSPRSGRVFMDMQVFDSYYHFLVMKDKKYLDRITEKEARMFAYMSKYFGDGKRLNEIKVLGKLITEGFYKFNGSEVEYSNIKSIFTTDFAVVSDKFIKNDKFSLIDFDDETKTFKISDALKTALSNETFLYLLNMLIDYAKYSNKKNYGSQNDFYLNEKYTKRDFCRIGNLSKNIEGTLYGYKLNEKENILPFFVNYKKTLSKFASTNYKDEFINNSYFVESSKNGYTLESGPIIRILEYAKNGLKIPLFVRKRNFKSLNNSVDDSETKSFFDSDTYFFLGYCQIVEAIDGKMEGSQKCVYFTLKLDHPVRDDIYEYIVTDTLG